MRAGVVARGHPLLVCLQSRAAAVGVCLLLVGVCVVNFVELGAVDDVREEEGGGAALAAQPVALTASEPPWLQDPDVMSRFTREGGSSFAPVDQTASVIADISKAQGQEDVLAYQRFFYGRGGGTFLEMGALDGIRYSNT
jgi:hypothetical protein